MNSIIVHNHFTSYQSAKQRNIRQVPQVFGLAMFLLGLSAPLTFAAEIPEAASSSGTGLVEVENPVSYADGRPYPSYRLNAVDQGMFLKYGEGPNQCDTMNAREAMINCVDGTYYLFYDGVGAKGWVACLAESRDMKTWERKGPLLEFGPGLSDSAAACSPWIIKDEKNLWHMFYLGTPNTTGGDYKIPIAPYLAMRATSTSPAGPWTKRYDPVPFSTKEGTYYSMSAYPGHVIKQGSEYMMFFGAADAKVRRTISIARTKDLNGEWTLDPTPALPVTENLENTSMYFEPTSNTWFMFVNHIGNECPDAVWVYWTNDINHWNPACKAIVLDGANCTWSKKNIGMPTVVTVGDKLYVFYDGAGGDSTNEMYRSIGKATLQLPLKVLDPEMRQVPVMNGSFETSGASPSGPSAKVGSPWSTIEAPAGFQQQQVVTAGAFTRNVEGGGEWAVPISADVTPDSRPLSQFLPRNVSPGDKLTVTFWLGRAKNTPGGKGEAYFDVSGTKYSMAFDTTSLPADSWKSYTLTQTITHSGSLSLGFYGTSKDNSWLDKISDVTVTPAAVDAKSPKCTGATLTTLEGKPKPLKAGDFGYSDPKSSPLTAVQITSLAPFGTLKLNGTPVDLNQIVKAADISKLSYQPDLNGNGVPYASIGFKAKNANNLWSRAASLLLNVTPVNDPPTSSGASALTRKGTSKTFAAADFPYSDVDTGDMLDAIKITSLPAHGTLMLSAKPITSVPSAAIPVANLEDLTYTSAANYTGADLFRYQVRDRELFSADATMALTVTSDIFVLNGSFEMPNPPTTSPGGPWGNLDSAWTNKLGSYARRRDSSTPPGGGLWVLNLSDQGSWIEQDLGVSVEAESTLSVTFSTLREDLFKSPNGGQGAFEASFMVGTTKYTERFDLSGDAKDTWVTKTFTKKIENTGNLSIRFSHVDTASTGDRITIANANNGPGEIGRVAIDKVGNVSVKTKEH